MAWRKVVGGMRGGWRAAVEDRHERSVKKSTRASLEGGVWGALKRIESRVVGMRHSAPRSSTSSLGLNRESLWELRSWIMRRMPERWMRAIWERTECDWEIC